MDARHSVVFSMSGEGNDRKIIVGSQFMALPLALSVWYLYAVLVHVFLMILNNTLS